MSWVSPAEAQIISPGKLSAAHQELEGMRQCTGCHELRKAGTSNTKCLACHRPLSNRLARRQGFHARVSKEKCAACHKEHFGRDSDIVRFDTASFDHSKAGYELDRGHSDLKCESCHQPSLILAADVRVFKGPNGALRKTFLGLPTDCVPCHRSEDPHLSQFPRSDCRDCHDANSWDEAPLFDHNTARYRLTGLHRDVACSDCHMEARAPSGESYVQYASIPFGKCTYCHTDAHDGGMGQKCAECHVTGGWNRINRNSFEGQFDHATTDYALEGKHTEVSCTDCHSARSAKPEGIQISFVGSTIRSTYAQPIVEDCVSCHIDYHEAEFEASVGGLNCENCHTLVGWVPTDYDFRRHNEESTYTLTGGHVTTPCASCHEDARPGYGWRYHFPNQECEVCHASDDAHQGQLEAKTCDVCHTTEAWWMASVDHNDTRYPLDGAHEDVPCASCHMTERTPTGEPFVRYRPVGMECTDCHEAE